MANTHSTLYSLFTAIANAIRAKTGSSASIVADQFPTAISAISTGVDTSDATATASDILSGKTAYVNGSKVTGSIATKTANNLSASGATVTVPAGYYASQTTKSVTTTTQATPSVSVSSSGLITASATQTAGYVSAGTKSGTKQLTTQAAKTITPSASAQTAVASGVYTTGAVTVAGDANLTAANIKSGVSIFGVTGSAVSGFMQIGTTTISGNGSVTFTIPASQINGASYVVIIFDDYHICHSKGGSTITSREWTATWIDSSLEISGGGQVSVTTSGTNIEIHWYVDPDKYVYSSIAEYDYFLMVL